MIISKNDFSKMEDRKRADFFNRLHGFKSPVLIGTQNKQGIHNLTLISNLFHIGANPPLLGIIFRPNTVPRHGLENILESKKYTINFLTNNLVKQAHQSSARYEREESEFEKVGLESEILNDFQAPFVKSSPLKMAVNMKEKVDIKINCTHMIIGEIDFIVADSKFDELSEISNIAVNGLDTYYKVQKIAKYSYAKPDRKLKEL